MNSLAVAPSAGVQQPRLRYVPDYVSTAGPEAIELSEMAGLYLDEWQRLVLTDALGERPDGKWAAFEVGLTVPRQNGKGGILEARELAGLFLLNERLIVHSAHEFATAEEALERMAAIIEGTPDFSRRVKAIKRSHGQEGIYLTNGQRLRYRTRTKGGTRGFTCDCLIYDEDMVLSEWTHGATLPTLSAIPNPQVWYTGSAVDQEVHPDGIVKSRLRQRALKGEDPALAYFEWSPGIDSPDDVTAAKAKDPAVWAVSNPARGIRISDEHIGREQRSMSSREFAVERLNVGDWPDPDQHDSKLIPNWLDLVDEDSDIHRAREFAFDVSPNRNRASICVAGRRKDGLYHVEVVEHRPGTGWLVDRLCELVKTHRVRGVVADERGPGAAFISELKNRRVRVYPVRSGEYAAACGRFYDCCGVPEDGAEGSPSKLRHRDDEPLNAAVAGAAQRPLGDAWAWSRKNSSVDITPLVACTLALHRASGPERTGRSMA